MIRTVINTLTPQRLEVAFNMNFPSLIDLNQLFISQPAI